MALEKRTLNAIAISIPDILKFFSYGTAEELIWGKEERIDEVLEETLLRDGNFDDVRTII